jgi:amino acid adenylation domain-containing protein
MSLALLGDRLEEVARRRDEAIAIVDGERRISYRELLLRSGALARELEFRGIGPRDLVGVALPRSAELVIAVVGVVRAGAAYLPIDLDHPPERRALILSDAHPKLVVAGDALIDGVPPEIEFVRLPQNLSLGLERRPHPKGEDPLYVIYTSGSTGRPKGVVVTQRNAARLFTTTAPLFRFNEGDVWTLFHSIAFDFSVWELWGALLHGGRIVVVPTLTARAADAFHSLVVREGVTILNQTPSAFRAFDAADAAAGRPLNQLSHVVLGGEALDPRSLKSWFQSRGDERPRVANMYGITETTVHVTYRRMLAADADGSGRSMIGGPLPDLRVDLLGPDGRPVETGEVGEIFVGGEGVSAGYLGRPDLTAERFLPDPRGTHTDARLYRSGDLARQTPDGDIEYLGRADDQVKLRGFRIELGEIESALRSAANVRDAVVALRHDSAAGPRLAAYVVEKNSEPLEPLLLREHLAQRLPEYMVPSAYVQIRQVPRTHNDKIDRAALPPPTAADFARAAGGAAACDDWERAVAKIFSDVLDVSVTGRESDFFRCGGDSLLAIRVAVLCHERLNVDVSIGSIFDNPTVAALAAFARREKNGERTAKCVAHVPRGGAVPLSPSQHALWLDIKIRPGLNTYNEAMAFRVDGRLEPARLLRTLEKLARAHEVLRARVIEVDGEPRFVFDRPASAIQFESSEADVSDDTERELTEAMHRPFDLNEGPLWRAVLRNKPDGGSSLLLVLHHLILDAASESVLLGELAAGYTQSDASPTPRAYDFSDLAAHERIRLESEREALEQFWADNLAGAELVLELPPPCVPCSREMEDDACISRREIGPALARRVRDLAASWGSTPFHLYLTAYLVLLRTYTAADDLVVGSPVSLRDTPAAEGVVGYLLSPAALRVQLAGDHSFRETFEDVRVAWREVRAHARLPMHLALRAARDGEGAGIGSPVQVFFSLVQDPGRSLLIDGYALQRLRLPPAHTKFNLFLLVREHHEDASLELEFRRGVFDPDMGNRFLHHLEVLLLAATENPESSLANLPLVDQTEQAQIREWATHSALYPKDRTVVDLFEEAVRKQRSKTALVAGTHRISYEALDSRANAVAVLLRGAGVRQGDRVPLLMPRGIEFIACALAAMKCGAAYVPLEPSYPPERLRRMLEGLEIRVGLRDPGLSTSYDAVTWLDAPSDVMSSPSALPRRFSADHPAYIMFTSGSTGRPKGVEIPHRAIVRLLFGQDFARMGPEETWLHMAPTSFDASTLEIWAPLLHGGHCVILEDSVPTPKRLAEVIRTEGVTSAWITSSLFNTFVDIAPRCLSGLTQILIGGEALSPSHVRRALDQFPGVRLVNGYGPTENTTFTCCHVIGHADIDSRRTIPIGRPIANTTVHVLDSDGRHAPIGVPGELVTGGDGVALGYVGLAASTEQSFLPDTFSDQIGARRYRTSDRVRWLPDGVLEFLGRFDNQIKIRGHRVEPDDVAACLAEHELVRQALVIARLGTSGAAQLVAYVVPRRKDDAAHQLREQLMRRATESLPSYMVPASFVFLNELPLKPNGKPDLAALEDAKSDILPAWEDAPLTSTELRVLGIFRDVLHNGELGPDDDFFKAGGDSLLGIRLMLQLGTEFGREFPVFPLDKAFTARRLAAIIESPHRATYPAGVVEIREGTGRPIFCLLGLGATALQFRTLSAKMDTRRPIVVIELHNLRVNFSAFKSIRATAAAVIQRMRQLQPVGPYTILGYSYGGNLAIEVATQLAADDQALGSVIILDAFAPDSWRSPKGLRKLATHARIIRRLNIRESYAYISSRILQRLFLRSQNPGDSARPLPKDELARRMSEVSNACLDAVRAHRPKVFPGRIVLLRASDLDDWLEVADRSGTCGWGTVCEGGVDVIPLGCRHLDIFKEPNVTVLTGHINDLLNATDKAVCSLIFVVGALRSGTTLFRLMLSSHEDIASPGEADCLFEYLQKDASADKWSYNMDGLRIDRIFQRYRFDIPDVDDGKQLALNLVDQIRRRTQRKYLALFIHGNLDKVAAFFPDAKIIHLIRDPRDVASSTMGMGWAGNTYFGVDGWLQTESNWNESVSKIDKNNVMEFYYENLIKNTKEQLEDICNFIGVPYSPNMLSYDNASTYQAPDIAAVEQWKTKLSARDVALVEVKSKSLLLARNYALSGYPLNHPSVIERLYLKCTHKLYIYHVGCMRYGYINFMFEKITRKFIRSYHRMFAERINDIQARHLK